MSHIKLKMEGQSMTTERDCTDAQSLNLFKFYRSARRGGATELIFRPNILILSKFTERHIKKSHSEPTWDGPS